MKPVSIIFLIVSVILVIVGLIICSVSMLQAKRQNVDLYDTKIVNGQSEAEYDFSEDIISKIQIEVGDCDVHIICGADENKVVMNNFSSAGYICEVNNRALVVEDSVNVFNIPDIIENGKIRFKGFRYFLRDRKITAGGKSLYVYVSEKFDIKVIDVSVEKGDVTVKGYNNNTDYKVKIGNGRFEASDITTRSLVEASVGSGSVNLQHVSAQTVTLNVKDGSIMAVLAANEITADTEKGSVRIESEKDLSEYNFKLKATASTITLEDLIKAGTYTANDAQLTNFIHASAGGGTVVVKSYIAPISPADTETDPSEVTEPQNVTETAE